MLESNAGQSDVLTGYNLETFEVHFDVSHLTFTEGQYYKIQMAYIGDDKETVGYYSTVGVVKYTTEPEISIDGLRFGHINTHNYTYTGVYSQLNKDTTEKMYSYRFQVFDGEGKVIEDTDYQLHNTMEDDLVYEQHETFTLARDLNIDESYYLQFSVITLNGLNVKTSKYRIMQRRAVSPEIQAQLNVKSDFDNGLIEVTIGDVYKSKEITDEAGNIKIIQEKIAEVDPVISGSFVRCSI